MKNLRTAASASLALTAALALSACTPPHQNDSDQPFKDNQTGQSSPSLEIESSETAESSAGEQGASSVATDSSVFGSETAATEGFVVDPGFTNEGAGTHSGEVSQAGTPTDTSAQ